MPLILALRFQSASEGIAIRVAGYRFTIKKVLSAVSHREPDPPGTRVAV